jgi:hypothetical protein
VSIYIQRLLDYIGERVAELTDHQLRDLLLRWYAHRRKAPIPTCIKSTVRSDRPCR